MRMRELSSGKQNGVSLTGFMHWLRDPILTKKQLYSLQGFLFLICLILCSQLSWVSGQTTGTFYDAQEPCVITTLPLVGVKLCLNNQGVVGSTNIWCLKHQNHNCSFVEPQCRNVFQEFIPAPSSTPTATPGLPMSSATPIVTFLNCNRTGRYPGGCTTNCTLDGYCRTCLSSSCPPLTKDQNGNFNMTGPKSRYGLINDACGNDDDQIDEGWRPKCACDSYDLNYCVFHDSNYYGNFRDPRCVNDYSLCYPPFQTESLCVYANTEPCVSFRVKNGTVFWLPYYNPQDPVVCLTDEGEIHKECQLLFEGGSAVNGNQNFCNEYPCDPSSYCDCRIGVLGSNCTNRFGEVFKLPVKGRFSGFNTEELVKNENIPFSVTENGCNLKITSSGSFLVALEHKSFYSLPGDLNMCDHQGKKVNIITNNERRSLTIQKLEEPEQRRNVLWIIFCVSVLVVLGGLLLIVLCYSAVYIWKMRITQRMLRGLKSVMRELKPERAILIMFLSGVIATTTSVNSTHDCVVRPGCVTGLLNVCGDIKTTSEFYCYPRPKFDCEVVSSCFGEEETHIYQTTRDCEVREGLSGVADVLSCSDYLSIAIIALIITLLLLSIMTCAPPAWATFILILSLLPRVKSCDVSQTIQSGAQTCTTIGEKTSCSYTTTLDFELSLGQTFCADFTNSYGQVNQSIVVRFNESTTFAIEKSLFYSSSFESHSETRLRCNDCFISCNGDCSKDSCELVGGKFLNPNNQISSAYNWCPGMSGCSLTSDGTCLKSDNCEWWQSALCPTGVTYSVREITGSKSVQLLDINGSAYSSNMSQPSSVGSFLVSSSSQQDPINFGTLGFKTHVYPGFVCDSLPSQEPKSGEIGDFRCKTSNCSESSPNIGFDISQCQSLGVGVVECTESFLRNIASSRNCAQLPSANAGVSIEEIGNKLLIRQVDPAKVRVLLSLQGYNVEYKNSIPTVKIKSIDCSGISNQTAGVNLRVRLECKSEGRIGLSLASSDISTGYSSIDCLPEQNLTATSSNNECSGTLMVGTKVQNDSKTFTCELEDFQGDIGNDQLEIEDNAEEETKGIWHRIFDGEGSFFDWLIAISEVAVLLFLIFILGLLLWFLFPLLSPLVSLITKCFSSIRSRMKKKPKGNDIGKSPKKTPPKKVPETKGISVLEMARLRGVYKNTV